MNKELNQYITTCVPLTDEQLIFLNGYFQKKIFKKKTFLLQQGEVCKFEAFILKGLVKTYFIDHNGFEVILTFACENWWVSDIISFHEQKPSKMYIELIEDSELLILTPIAKAAILNEIPSLERMFRLMVQRHLASYQDRLFGNIALSAEERYELFLHKYPNLPQRIPQHLIASYLGISAEFLSRIRKRKSKK
ncbi:Crp/Fnr family transcriptional regulator [Emticicia sp. SJ17W-69]|uniref:Crp/Fnr family transcriptional regulator n=1 Tax=Emticicia sp. SJ17W-69 TaxID=3421657 RepID=UPI003EB7A73D